MASKEVEPTKGKGGWLGAKPKQPEPQFKVSVWATKAEEGAPIAKFAPLQKSEQEKRIEGAGRREQEFVFTSKKEQEERKKLREAKQALEGGDK